MTNKETNTTLNYYNTNSEEYFNSTKSINMTHLYKDFLNFIPPNGAILDLGCGSGRDSLYFKNKGYKITSVDGSKELANLAESLLTEKVIVSNFEDLDLNITYDGIWACASLLHVKRDDLLKLLIKYSKNLNSNGVFYLSFKYGDTEHIDEKGRYFNCYTESTFRELIENVPEFKIISIYKSTDTLVNRPNLTWLNILLSK